MSGLVNELVFSVHGVESVSEWQLRITPELSGIHGLIHVPYSYGQFKFWRVLRKSARQAEIDRFYAELSRFQQAHPTIRPSVIAHSFGTYILAQTLVTYPAVDLDRIILCGSIIDRNYDWGSLLKTGRVRRIRNEVAGKDGVVGLFRCRVMRLVVPFTGASGVDAFSASLDELEQPKFAHFNHSSHFIAAAHCRRYWIPFLRATRDFANLCRECVDRTNPERATAKANFAVLYDSAIKSTIASVFRKSTKSELSDLFQLLREEIASEGAKGQRSFYELLELLIRSLVRHVPPDS